MSSSYNNTISSSSTQSFPLLAIGANNFNREETAMTMNQQRPNSVSPPPRRLRNKPGNPSPDAEVIALTPEEIMATNRFQCEVCEKGFQRQQNLQLHRRGHNLPFNLKQKSDEEIRRKVYVCPEPTCVYHDPSRALGDLTGIKKHYCRKHGEKKFKCEKCDKFYAVESDCKAHSKICGTKEYRCVCGTKFSRSDSYETHRAFCEALAQESAGNPNLSFTEMLAAAGGSDGSSRDGLHGGASSALSHNHFGDNSNSGFAPPGAGFNLNRSSSPKFEDFFPQSTNPNHGPTTNFPMQYPSNQGLLARNDQNLMNQHGLINNNNVPSAQLRGSSVAANNFGGSGNVNFQGQMNSLAATSGQQGRPGPAQYERESPPSSTVIFSTRSSLVAFCNREAQYGVNLTAPDSQFICSSVNMLRWLAALALQLIEGPDRRTLDFLGVNGRGGRNEPPLDLDMKFSDPNNPFGNV
uniref:C2H2-type domain-containing protein n=1 Tax=Brassica campestris TaxID=3711 RepID=M4EBP4_BRACM